MNSIEFGAKQAVVNCVGVKRGEKVVVITDIETEKIAAAIIKEVEKAGGIVQKFVMEDFGPRPKDGSNPLRFPDELGKAMAKAQASFYVAGVRKGEYETFRKPFRQYVFGKNLRHAHMMTITEQIMCDGMCADYEKVKQLSKRVFDIVSVAKEICVTTTLGTDFVAGFDPKYKWISLDGDIQKPGSYGNLPDGEVFGYPVTVDGLIVVDGCFGDFFTEKYGSIEKTPLSYKLKDGRCVKGSVACENAALKKEFEEYTFGTDENSDRAGEFGIGTNIGLTRLVGTLLQDEKFPGVHLALGSPFPHRTGAEWDSKAHNDGIMKNPTVVVDGKMIMKDGRFTI